MILVEVPQRSSTTFGLRQRLERVTRHLDKHSGDTATVPPPLPRAPYQPRKLAQRLSAQLVTTVVAAYEAGASSREIAGQFNLAHSSVQKLLRQQGITLRRRGPRAQS